MQILKTAQILMSFCFQALQDSVRLLAILMEEFNYYKQFSSQLFGIIVCSYREKLNVFEFGTHIMRLYI